MNEHRVAKESNSAVLSFVSVVVRLICAAKHETIPLQIVRHSDASYLAVKWEEDAQKETASARPSEDPTESFEELL